MTRVAKKTTAESSTQAQRRASRRGTSASRRRSVFLSYNSADRAVADSVASRLTEAGYEIANRSELFEPGENWLMAVGRALSRSDAVVVFLSRAALESRATASELEFALSSRRFKGKVVPVLLDPDAEVPWIVRRLPFVAMRPGSERLDRVAKAVLDRLDQRV